jgi:hypothetical protein
MRLTVLVLQVLVYRAAYCSNQIVTEHMHRDILISRGGSVLFALSLIRLTSKNVWKSIVVCVLQGPRGLPGDAGDPGMPGPKVNLQLHFIH